MTDRHKLYLAISYAVMAIVVLAAMIWNIYTFYAPTIEIFGIWFAIKFIVIACICRILMKIILRAAKALEV